MDKEKRARTCRGSGVSLPNKTWAALKNQAKHEDRPLSWVVRRAVERYLEHEVAADGKQAR